MCSFSRKRKLSLDGGATNWPVRDCRSFSWRFVGHARREDDFFFFFLFWRRRAFNIITLLRGLGGIYTIKLSCEEGQKDKGGGMMERHRQRATLFIRWVHDGREFSNEEGRAGWQEKSVCWLTHTHSEVRYSFLERMLCCCTPISWR